MLGARLGSFQINFQFCWPIPKSVLSTWYIFATMCQSNVWGMLPSALQNERETLAQKRHVLLHPFFLLGALQQNLL